MHKEHHKWYSQRVEMEMPIVVYGHHGIPLLMFPTASADCEEYERFHLISAMGKLIDSGKVKIFSIDSINRHAWGAENVHPGHKAYITQKYDEYIREEVVPFIYSHCQSKVPIIVSGASMGAFYAANTFLKHPDVIHGLIGMHGVYDLDVYAEGYNDLYCYYNNPTAFVPNLHDHQFLETIRSHPHIFIITSHGQWEKPEFSIKFSNILSDKAIPNVLHIWDHNWPHDWTSWRKVLPHYMKMICSDLL